MTIRSLILALTAALLFLPACGGSETDGPEDTADLPESGTYTGTVAGLNPEESEIYFESQDSGVFELYFTDSTEVTGQSGEIVPYDSLALGQSVDVTVERDGEELNPLAVTINQKAPQTDE